MNALQRTRSESLKRAILEHIASLPVSFTAGEIAAAVERPLEAVQIALHQLDDAGRVVMRNGWYQLSEAKRKRRDAV